MLTYEELTKISLKDLVLANQELIMRALRALLAKETYHDSKLLLRLEEAIDYMDLLNKTRS